MFRFTIRDVLWLTVVVALAVGWLVDHRAVRSTLEAAKHEIVATQVFLRECGGVAESRDGHWVVGDNRGNYYVVGPRSAAR